MKKVAKVIKEKPYDPAKIEFKWQKKWQSSKIYKTKEDNKKPKYYVLDMFPYPSGEGLHVGHPKGYIATDIISRYKRMKGFSVLHPMGFDAFGLPAENYALKTKTNPADSVKKNVARYKKQLEILGFDYDWAREVNTTDPKYYKWTQWIFLKLLEKGLAYESYEPINWCPSCKTGLANEDVEDGKCERCGTVVEKKPMRQWVLKITDYAERLLMDLDIKKDSENLLDWPESIKILQKNWIGKSEGAIIKFKVQSAKLKVEEHVEVFTTRIDTIFSGTFVVVSPEHKIINELNDQITNIEEVKKFIDSVKNKSEVDRLDKNNKDGIRLEGVNVINPATGEEIQVWVSDFVLGDYGTGAVFADAHDQRDFDIAKKYGIPLKVSIKPENDTSNGKYERLEECFEGEGVLINSGQFDGLKSAEARPKIIAWLAEKGLATPVTKYKLRDWVFSRQRYWGEPIPVIHCASCYARENGVNAVIVHGCPSNAEKAMNEKTRTYDKHWIKWTASKLEELGVKLATPYMPTPWEPSYESWKQEFEKLEIDENSILIGHSCGTAFLVRWLGETKRKVNTLILVAPWKIAPNESKKQFYEFDIDRSIKERVKNIYAFTSDDEEQDGKESVKIYSEALELKVIELKKHGHFTMGDMGTVEFPELIDLISSFSSKIIPVPEKDLPVILPKVKSYEPTGTGESPLAAIAKWVNVKCPVCKSPAKRETNTMPQWAGSSWYYLRYIDPKNNKVLASEKTLDYWCGDKDDGVDLYVGGAEHATRHLIYARFWHKFLYDIGVVSNIEPFLKLQHVGLIMGEDGRKMSKRFLNVINPDEIAKNYGADSLRLYEMFMGPFDQQIAWSTSSISGVRRFIEKVWRLREKVTVFEKVESVDKIIHKTIKKVTEDIENMRYNTAISCMMIAINEIENAESISKDQYEIILKLLAPFAPYFTEELWVSLGNKKSIHLSSWPEFDPALIVKDEVNIMVQVNGKVRGSFTSSADADNATLETKAKEVDEVKKWLDGKKIIKVIVVPKRLVNFVVG
jgi:leucyl-tRNA synthetase